MLRQFKLAESFIFMTLNEIIEYFNKHLSSNHVLFAHLYIVNLLTFSQMYGLVQREVH